MSKVTILWADDEIELLKPQILFLQEKGYEVIPVSNGQDAIEKIKENGVDVVFLDESMPGLSGLETLPKIKGLNPSLPVVLITKNEEENLMEEAIGSQITDYLIKPVKPNQILLTLKKIIDNKRLITEKTTSAYQQDFQRIFASLSMNETPEQWAETYRQIVDWELKLESSETQMQEVLTMQKNEANTEFNKFIISNYLNWLNNEEEAPVMSHTLFSKKLFPLLTDDVPTFLILIDNLRFDQWKVIRPLLSGLFRVTHEELFYSILPTTTHYSRNAIFAGLTPLEIQTKFPSLWKHDTEEGGKNQHEHQFLDEQIKSAGLKLKHDYVKIANHQRGKDFENNVLNYLHNGLTAVVYNFVDMLSHARTEMEMLKELASDEPAYRSITRSWFIHSPLFAALKKLADKQVRLVFTSDHGTIRVTQPSRVVGDKNTTTNLRYKQGRNLQYNEKEVFAVANPEKAFLPKANVSSAFIFAKENRFFAYPNNYNYYVNYFKDTFQHGGISLEEMLIPFAVLESK